jgi:hypothetical protein
MNLDLLNKIIAMIGGEDKVAAFIFNNSARKCFRKDEFKLADHLDAVNELLIFEEEDVRGNKFKVYKPIYTIEAVLGVDDPAILDLLDQRYIGG